MRFEADLAYPIEWAVSPEPVAYERAVRLMEERVRQVADATAPELVWLLEHPPLYTAGTGALPSDLLEPNRFPVHRTGRGGKLTYHGPGQRIAYVMIDVKRRFGGDVRAFMRALEDWLIAALAPLGVAGETRPGRIGVWVRGAGAGHDREAKIAAIGARLRHGISFHGIALNVAPDLAHYSGIVPCGIREFGVTSLAELGVTTTMKDVDISLQAAFELELGQSTTIASSIELR